ncbi:Tyrosine--tRNA ligase [compost metagenome]
MDVGIEPSKRQAREDILNGAISMNGERVDDINMDVTIDKSFDGRFIIIRKGKKSYSLVKLGE